MQNTLTVYKTGFVIMLSLWVFLRGGNVFQMISELIGEVWQFWVTIAFERVVVCIGLATGVMLAFLLTCVFRAAIWPIWIFFFAWDLFRIPDPLSDAGK